MRHQILTASAVLLCCSLLTPGLRAAGDEEFWTELDATSEPDEWRSYQARDPKLEAEVWQLLRSATSGEVKHDLVIEQLVDRGSLLVPVLFAILTGEFQDEERAAESTPEVGEVRGRPRDKGEVGADELVLETLAEMPAAAVVDHMGVAATGEAPTEIRVLAARVLARTGGVGALDVMLEVLASMDPLQLQRPFLRGPFSDAVQGVLRRNPQELRDLDERLEDLHLEVTLLVVESLPPELFSDGAPVVLALFGQDERLDLALMDQLAEFARSPLGASSSWSSLDCLRAVQAHLGSKDWHMRSRALVATARLKDTESLELLVDMLDDEHRSVARTAHWSLREMTGQEFEPKHERWADWLAAERAWFAGPRAGVEWAILSGEDAQIIAGIRELNQHLIFRDSSTDLLGPLLLDASPAVSAAVIGILDKLDSPRAIPFLVDCLDAREEYKRDAAWQALQRRTQLGLPQQRAVWQDRLGI